MLANLDDLHKSHIRLMAAQRNQLAETMTYGQIKAQVEQESGKVYNESTFELEDKPKE